MIVAIGESDDSRQPRVWVPDEALSLELGFELKSSILAMQRMIITARKKRPEAKDGFLFWREQTPPEHGQRYAIADENLKLDFGPVFQAVDPLRPGIGFELLYSCGAVRVHNVRVI